LSGSSEHHTVGGQINSEADDLDSGEVVIFRGNGPQSDWRPGSPAVAGPSPIYPLRREDERRKGRLILGERETNGKEYRRTAFSARPRLDEPLLFFLG